MIYPCFFLWKIAAACAINGAIYTLLVVVLGFACVYSALYRHRMRNQFNLKGSNCGDCCIHSFCEVCALCQEYRELKIRGFDMHIGWHANVDRQNREVMTTPPPHSSMTR
ncbi:Protein PLANT CADMIUM RESISTANCE 2 [Bienertia sinuspersici]